MKYLVQTNSISDEKGKDLDYGRVILDTTDSAIYVVGYGWKCKMVDLGLPSGTLWMDRNIGASSPSDYGLYFAWGETDGYTADEVGNKKQFSWDDYKYANGAYDRLTKYCNKSSYGNDGYTDSLVALETTDDMVLQNVHKYSMPTKAQLQELLDNTTSEWTTQDGVNGRLFTSKANGNSIFVPAAGVGSNGSMDDVGSGGGLWSSSLYEGSPSYAWGLAFYSSLRALATTAAALGCRLGVLLRLLSNYNQSTFLPIGLLLCSNSPPKVDCKEHIRKNIKGEK